MIGLLIHLLTSGHRDFWSEEMIWSGGRGRVWYCGCNRSWHPLGNPGPRPNGSVDPIKRERPRAR